MGDVLKHPMHEDKNSPSKEKLNKEQYDIDLAIGEDDTRSKDDADDSPYQLVRSTVGTSQQSNCGNRLHTVAAAAPRSALVGKQTPKKGVKVNFPKYYLDKSRVHESKYRRPLQPTRRRHGPDS